jgi:hypothetical protein
MGDDIRSEDLEEVPGAEGSEEPAAPHAEQRRLDQPLGRCGSGRTLHILRCNYSALFPGLTSPSRPPCRQLTHRLPPCPAEELLPELLVANTDVTIQAPIDEYYQNLGVRLEELKREFTKIEARTGHEQSFEDYIQGDREFAEGVQQNSQRYYDALKVLRADTQVRTETFTAPALLLYFPHISLSSLPTDLLPRAL